MSSSYEKETSLLEEIFPHSRNLDFVELKQLVSMAPYVILPSLNSFSRQVAGGGQAHHRRSILVDVGANNSTGAKLFGIICVIQSIISRVAGVQNLIDAYTPFEPFSDVHLFDVKPIEVPEYYSEHYNITVHPKGVRVGSGMAKT